MVIGKNTGHLYQSELFREVLNFNDGQPPAINLFNEKNNGLTILTLISKKLLNSVHDISSGGLILTLTEMCITGNMGAKIKIPTTNIGKIEYLFSEDQSRYLIEIQEKHIKEVTKILDKNSIYYELIGKTQKEYLNIDKEFTIEVAELSKLNSVWFKNYYRD